VGLFFRGWACPLSSNERNSLSFCIPRPFHDPNFVGTIWDGPFLFQHDCALVHKARSIRTLMSKEELHWPAQSPNFNPIEDLWDELEWRLRARPSCPTSVPDLTNALLKEW